MAERRQQRELEKKIHRACAAQMRHRINPELTTTLLLFWPLSLSTHESCSSRPDTAICCPFFTCSETRSANGPHISMSNLNKSTTEPINHSSWSCTGVVKRIQRGLNLNSRAHQDKSYLVLQGMHGMMQALEHQSVLALMATNFSFQIVVLFMSFRALCAADRRG